MADDLVFGLQMSPREVDQMTPGEVRHWHARAIAYQNRRKSDTE